MIFKNENGDLRTAIAIYYIARVCHIIIKSEDENMLLAYELGDLELVRYENEAMYAVSKMDNDEPIFHLAEISVEQLDLALDSPASCSILIESLKT